jgi:PAS domain S-box-containing protein
MNISLERKIILGVVVVILMLALLGIVSYHSIHRFTATAGLDNHARQVLTHIGELSNENLASDLAAHAFVISHDDDCLADWHRAVNLIAPSIDVLDRLTADNPDQQHRLQHLDQLLTAKLDRMREAMPPEGDESATKLRQYLEGGESRIARTQISGVLTEMKHAEEQILQARMIAERSSSERTIVILSGVSILAILSVMLAGWMIRRDILARRQAERALQEARERFGTMIEAVQDYAIFTLDAQGHVTSWNRGAERIHGYQSQEILGRHFSLFHMPDNAAQGRPQHELEIASEEGRYEDETWRVRKDGSTFWANVIISAVRNEQGELQGFTKVTRDITERMRAEKRIRDLNKSLEEHASQLEVANKELEAFSYSVSHDLRAPLRSIDGFSQALLEDYANKLDEGGNDYLQRVRGATQRMGQLIDDLLNLSRITRSEMRRQRVDLSEMAADVAAELQKSQPDRVVSFVIAEGLAVEGDSHLLRVVMDNLIGNAWKFTNKTTGAVIEVGSCPNGAFFVRDNGVGFDMKYSQKLFGAFQRLHGMNEFAGTGIGLATVQRIIHRHGGRVWAEGAIDQGATFYFAVTADAAPALQAA